MKKFILPVALALTFSAAGFGQEASEFNISIADKTEETPLLKKNETQVEAGFLYTHFQEGTPADIGQLFIRKGISSRLELRVMVEDGRNRDRYIDETVQSTYPLSIGAKLKVLEEHPFLPDMTLVGYLNLPFTAHNKTQSMYWSPILFMAFQHQFAEKWSITYNAGAQQEAFGTSWSAILNGAVHYKINDDLELFSEYFAQYEPLESPQHNVGGGFTYSLSDMFAIYLSGGTTVKYEEPNYFFTGGLAVRFQ